MRCFADNYNYTHYDSKKGTNGHIERLGHKFGGIPLQYGCKVRYLPHAEREVEQREKLDPSLRDGIFVGYRSHSGGRWTQQYEVIDAEAYSKITKGSGRKDHVHAVSEIYVPGSAGDDQEKHRTFPCSGWPDFRGQCFRRRGVLRGARRHSAVPPDRDRGDSA